MGDGIFHHPHRTIGKIRHLHTFGRSIYVDEGIFRHMHVLVLRHAWHFLQCTLVKSRIKKIRRRQRKMGGIGFYSVVANRA
jgi:hypothetical protein